MHTRTLGQGLEVSAIGLGCMGMSQSYGPNPGDPRGHDRRAARRRRPRRHVLRHRRGVRPVCQRGTRRRGPGARARPGGDRHQVRLGHRRRQDRSASTADPSRSVASPRRRCIGCGSTRSTCSTSTGSTPTCRSRTSPARSASSWPPARSATSGCPRPRPARSAARTPCTRSPLCRASTRCGPATPNRRCCRPAPSSGSGSSRSARWARASSPARSTTRHAVRDGDCPRSRSPGSRPRTSRPTRPSWTRCASSPSGKGATPGQVALAWLLAQQPWIVPIPGTRRLSRVEENAGATTVALSADERAELDHLADEVGVAGNRYNDAMMGMVGR